MRSRAPLPQPLLLQLARVGVGEVGEGEGGEGGSSDYRWQGQQIQVGLAHCLGIRGKETLMDAPLGQRGWGRGWLSEDQAPGDYSSADPTSWPGAHRAPDSLSEFKVSLLLSILIIKANTL